MEVCDLPPQGILEMSQRKQVFFDSETNMPFLVENQDGSAKIPGSKPLNLALQCQSGSFIDFV